MRVILSHQAHLKMKYYIDGIDFEISGLGVVEKLDNGDLYVPDIFLFKQEVSAAETTLHASDLDAFYSELLNREFANREERDAMDDYIGKIKLWWHSHVNMAVFWSGTDTATQDSLDIDQGEENWWLSIVGNKRGERKAKLDVYQPHRMWMDDLEIVVGEDLDLKDQLDKEILEKVTVRTPKYVTPSYQNGYTGRPPVDTRSAPYPRTNDMQEMADNLDPDEEYTNQNGIYLPKKKKKLRKSSNRLLN